MRRGPRKREGERSVGLARALSKLGYCSRSAASELIQAGRVRLNGAVRRDSETAVRIASDRIEVDGKSIVAAAKIYLKLNKPRGVVTTASDEKGRETVYDYLDAGMKWLAPVGRLDKASEGLLLLTNDSELGAKVADPKTHLDKVYHVQIAGAPEEALLTRLERGIQSEEDLLRVKHARILRRGERNCWLELILDEGKNRQIRRMLAESGVEVLRLIRVAIGPLKLGDLAKGKSRKLTDMEKQSLDGAMEKTQEFGT
jgi:23S rRNA pseudouridine2605 synthase